MGILDILQSKSRYKVPKTTPKVQNPLLMLGLFLFVVSLFRFFTSLFINEKNLVLYIYSVLMLVLIVTIFAFTIFATIVTYKGEGVDQGNYKLYLMLDYSSWLQRYVSNPIEWSEITKCLIASKICTGLGRTAFEFFGRSFSPIKAGCCIKPFYCGYDVRGSNFAKSPAYRGDCENWNKNEICYNCGSCKGGILANIKKEWRRMATLYIFVLIFVIILCSKNWCIKSDKRSNH